MNKYSLRISGRHHDQLRRHLFPGDGLEAVAFALCGRNRTDEEHIFTVHKVVPVAYADCDRTPISVAWPTEALAAILDDARRQGLAVMKFHSHPEFFERFSKLDDESDAETFASVSAWLDDGEPHGSAVMLPDGRVFGRAMTEGGEQAFSSVTVAGDKLSFWYQPGDCDPDFDGKLAAQLQLFGSGTTARLRRLRIGVVGCSGTGSFVVELLGRLAVGELVLIDDDRVEDRNLNRIVNAGERHVGEYKVDVLKRAVEAMGLGTKVDAIPRNLYDPVCVKKIAHCDVVFGCMDTAEGRHLLNRIAAFYVQPYFDLGVHLLADGEGGIDEASGVVHYLQPGGSSLFGRRAYTLEEVRAEGLRRTDPEAFQAERKAGYIEGADEKSPPVASLNCTIAGIAVNEFLSRLHPFRSCDPRDCDVVRFNFMETLTTKESAPEECPLLAPHVGRGDVEPLLGWSSLSMREVEP
ncbi:MAG: thiamine biosynthesis protein ThiF [Acidobacteria bacterium]|nr:hypothetical protein [Pyrinomonadaceae bacterium]RIJ96307.1 MAG: thiamine biosynthesis protein ThiF [Acidobacteriota bacterium]